MPYMHASAWVGIPFLRFSFDAYSVLFYEAPARARMLLWMLVGGSAFVSGLNARKVGTCSVRFSHVLCMNRCVCRYACVQALTPPHVLHGLGFLLALYPRYRSHCIFPEVFFHLSELCRIGCRPSAKSFQIEEMTNKNKMREQWRSGVCQRLFYLSLWNPNFSQSSMGRIIKLSVCPRQVVWPTFELLLLERTPVVPLKPRPPTVPLYTATVYYTVASGWVLRNVWKSRTSNIEQADS